MINKNYSPPRPTGFEVEHTQQATLHMDTIIL